MPFVTLAPSNHDTLSNVSADDHHTESHTSLSHPSFLHAELTDIGETDHVAVSTEAELGNETDANRLLNPSLMRFAPGSAKALCHITAVGGLSSPSFNVASITDTGTGDRTIVWLDDFTTAIYACASSLLEENVAGGQSQCYIDTLAVGSVRHRIYNESVALEDQVTSVIAFGVQ